MSQPTTEPGPLPHGMLKGFGVSMLITAIYVAMLLAAGYMVYDSLTGFAIFSFIPVFLMVNIGIALHYESKHFRIRHYMVGVGIAAVVDVGLIVLLIIAVLFLNFLGAAGAGGR